MNDRGYIKLLLDIVWGATERQDRPVRQRENFSNAHEFETLQDPRPTTEKPATRRDRRSLDYGHNISTTRSDIVLSLYYLLLLV
jgi:hypothetical protein